MTLSFQRFTSVTNAMLEEHRLPICYIVGVQVDILHSTIFPQVVNNVDELLSIGRCAAILLMTKSAYD